MTTSWLSAFDARKTIAERRGIDDDAGLAKVELAIIDYARTILPARCRFMWDRTINDNGPDERHDSWDASVPADVWNLTDDQKLDWDAGIFHLAGDEEDGVRYIKLAGVEFDSNVIDRIWPAPCTPPMVTPPLPKTSNAGRPRKDAWNDWIAYLVIAAPDIMREEGPEALITKVASLMVQDGLAEMPRSTVQPAAQAVIDLLERKQL